MLCLPLLLSASLFDFLSFCGVLVHLCVDVHGVRVCYPYTGALSQLLCRVVNEALTILPLVQSRLGHTGMENNKESDSQRKNINNKYIDMLCFGIWLDYFVCYQLSV